MANLNPDRVLESWKARGFHGGYWVDPPGRAWTDRVVDVDELLMVVDGAVELEVRGRKLRPEAGEEVLIPARVPHSIRNVGGTEAHWLHSYRGS